MEGGGTYQFNDTNKEAIEEEEVILIAEEDVAEGLQTCHKSLMGRIFVDRSFSTGTMEGAMYAIWGKPEGFRVMEKGNNLFQFFFEKETDAMRIERGSPWLLKGYVLHVRRWVEDVESKEMQISSFPLWAQLWGLPEQYKTIEVGHKLIGLRYERIGIFCTYCAHIGHEARQCQLFLQDSAENNIKQDCIGEWVKAKQTGKRIERKEGSIPDWIKNTS
ncbi:hypothetical protein PIB30_062635 [Stylosanthes scabra]|uniref:DUF4283 domain-containing protein n=1 Tax=Stylosanthes scabra TaxID=79078 RepID=A0ABU6VNL8_9FABA|nr:hypothetical protein [Stylosanthes scabra]